ncbi:MAG TPA: aminopeptidase P N-terminal domain-containing protein [Pyrinomonadaceae bacterium]|nr:aminopeptidase P N-terminal domain-containing protein [Pyrinomonadaceae bacterium]
MSLIRFNRPVTGVLIALLVQGAMPLFAAGHSAETPPRTSVIRLAPPAPVFDEKTRLAELKSRRARVGQTIGAKGILILFSTEPRVYANDVDYEYRQENNLYYLTGLKQKRATLVLTPSNEVTSEILFLPRRSPIAETWTGHMYSPEEASAVSGVTEIWDASEFEPFMRALRNRQPYRPKPDKILLSSITTAADSTAPSGFEKVLAAAGKNDAEVYMLVPGAGDSLEYRQEQQFASEWVKSASGYSIKNATPMFAEMRLRKSPYELALMQHAIDITTEAHERAWVAAAEAKWEYEVDAQVAYTFKLRNADHWGYPSIVGCGPNATTLHYEESQGQVKAGELLLMDVGAEYDHYSADVTRTFPVNGKFSTAQAEIYQIVYDAQEAAAKAARPGATVSDVNRAATEVIKDGLLRLGLITDRSSSQYRIWFMHGTSHWLGMNVHDVGNYGSKLEAGMVFTNEPGIYIRLDALDNLPKTPENEKFIAAVRPAFEKYKGIGVRIEDDMLITADGVKWMTEALPRKISEIEDFIARGRREAR